MNKQIFLLNKNHHFNIANIVTFLNITAGLLAIYFTTIENFFIAIILAWLGGAFDIIDGKLARKLNLSSEFGVQVDSFADFLSFVIMPPFLLFYAINKYIPLTNIQEIVLAIVFIWYIINGLIRLIVFNLTTQSGKVEKFFKGVPTPLGAILLWVLYLCVSYGLIANIYIYYALILLLAYLLNSKIKIPHP